MLKEDGVDGDGQFSVRNVCRNSGDGEWNGDADDSEEASVIQWNDDDKYL